jgi:hypothetical protein
MTARRVRAPALQPGPEQQGGLGAVTRSELALVPQREPSVLVRRVAQPQGFGAVGVRLTAGTPKDRRGASARRRRCPLTTTGRCTGKGLLRVLGVAAIQPCHTPARPAPLHVVPEPPRTRLRRLRPVPRAARTGPPQRTRPHHRTGAGGADATKRAAQTSSVADRHTAGKNVRGTTARGERGSPHLLPDECSRLDGTPIHRGRQPPSENVTNDPTCSTAYVAAYPGVSVTRRRVPGHLGGAPARGSRPARAGRVPT